MIDTHEAQSLNANVERRPSSAYYKSLLRSGFAPVNGFEMYYEIHGSGGVGKLPLVTIHPAWGLANVFPSLARNRQLIAPELQGHGRSTDIDRRLTFEQDSDDVAALLEHLQIEKADFFGESFGGVVAVMMAIRHTDLVGRVITYGTPFSNFQDAMDPAHFGQFLGGAPSPDSYGVQYQRDAYVSVAPDPTQWPTLFSKVATKDWKGFSPEQLKAITARLLVASGDHDFIAVEHSLAMSRLIPNAQLAIIPDATHFVLNEDSEKLLPAVAAFLDEPASKLPYATGATGYHPGVTR